MSGCERKSLSIVIVICIHHSLKIKIYLYFLIALCKRPCQNGGKCTKPGICICDADYEGAQCEKKKMCKKLSLTNNGVNKCNGDNCKIVCNKGFFLQDGTDVMEMKCKSGKWIPILNTQQFNPDCQC